jgi:arginyl-tRNA synthetase
VVRQCLELMGYGKQAAQLRHVSYGVVSLSRYAAEELGLDTSDGKQAYAMSGRQGVGMKISALLDRMEQVIAQSRSGQEGLSSRSIAAAAIRYYLLRYNLQTEVVFDLRQATEISGNTGVYLLYTYSRSVSVLNKGGIQVESAPKAPAIWPSRLEEAEHAVLRQLALWPEVLQSAIQELTPAILCNYAYEMCSLFNNFYGACPIVRAEADQRDFRLWLTARFSGLLREVLDVLGLPAPERM